MNYNYNNAYFAKWIKLNTINETYYCSHCGRKVVTKSSGELPQYCPKCHAEMQNGGESK